jgi:hypothetical protein
MFERFSKWKHRERILHPVSLVKAVLDTYFTATRTTKSSRGCDMTTKSSWQNVLHARGTCATKSSRLNVLPGNHRG